MCTSNGVPWVTGGSSSVAPRNLESMRPGLGLPPLTGHGTKRFSLGLGRGLRELWGDLKTLAMRQVGARLSCSF